LVKGGKPMLEIPPGGFFARGSSHTSYRLLLKRLVPTNRNPESMSASQHIVVT